MTETSDTVTLIQGVGGDPLDLPFWEACREGHFLLHRCELCGHHYWPATRCHKHGARAMSWVKGSGKGELYTYTVMHHAYTPEMKEKVPYVVGVVKLAEGPFFHSNIRECSPEEVTIGMALEAMMEQHESGLVVPVFRPVKSRRIGRAMKGQQNR